MTSGKRFIHALVQAPTDLGQVFKFSARTIEGVIMLNLRQIKQDKNKTYVVLETYLICLYPGGVLPSALAMTE